MHLTLYLRIYLVRSQILTSQTIRFARGQNSQATKGIAVKEQPKRILVYRIGQLGDTIIALPSLWVIRERFPSAYLCLLTNRDSGSDHVPATSVLPQIGLFDDWLTYQTNGSRVAWKESFHLLSQIRQGAFDTLIYLAPRVRTRSQVWRDLAFFHLAGIQRFLAHKGFELLPQRRLGGHLQTVQHEADHLLNRLALSGIPIPLPGTGLMELSLTFDERQRAAEWLEGQVQSKPFGKILVGVGPASKWPSKVWPEERYESLGRSLIEQLGVFPIIVGGPKDQALGRLLIKKWGAGANAAGELLVRETAALLSMCRFYVGNDTGAMHLAAAVGTPCVAIFSAQDWPGRWYPYGSGHVVFRQSVPCEGCMLKVCVVEEMRCLRYIEVEDVFAACRRICYKTATTSSK